MNNEIIKMFNDSPVRIIQKDSTPWFVAKDVCKVLEIKESHRSINSLDDDEKGRHNMTTLGGNQTMTIINESGLYSLILRSRKPEAKIFKRWITHEVIPAIRKHGAYLSPTITNEQMQSLLVNLEQEMYRRIEAENQVNLLEKAVLKLSEYGIPKAKFGEISQKTGLPKDIMVRAYIQSRKTPHASHLDKHIQLLLPLYVLEKDMRALLS